MAKLKLSGVETTLTVLERLAAMTEDDKWTILSAGAEVVKAAHQRAILKSFKQHTRQLLNSIAISKKIVDGDLAAIIAPTGKRKKGYTGKRKGKGGSYEGTNAEVAYLLEYGSPRIKARHWMENANEAAGDDMEQAMAQAWDEYLKSINL